MSARAPLARAVSWLHRPLSLSSTQPINRHVRFSSTATASRAISPGSGSSQVSSETTALAAERTTSALGLETFLDSLPPHCTPDSDTCTDPWSTVQFNDIVILRNAKTGLRRLTGPLEPEGQFSNETGYINHSDLIGLRPRDRINNHKGHAFTVHFPTLEEYVLLAPRAATPIYPKDASTILSMLDLPRPNARILEAGTGSGGLTVHLASAVASTLGTGRVLSVDMRKSHTSHATKFLSRFRRGHLRPYVDFVTGDLAEVLSSPTVPDSTFDGIVLDLLNPWDQVANAHRVLKPDGHLIVYAPNVTQVVKVLEAVKRDRLALAVVKCVEVSEREWEIKPVVIKWPEGKAPAKAVGEGEEEGPESWMCRPKHVQTGHTAFLLHLTCTKKGKEPKHLRGDQAEAVKSAEGS
ncbi:S-adenosyl-L-methionine-dependent methyltransferase [Catenaria anguillulae PL171]|uniref:tRNA (adenine(58)-N(1))-methyltransferase catalytic subunit TRM61 n=1 Tax=Catenaria anguillulae PL171 TaxID=765915 RepID=A0A1Y2I1M9_9FUNG|nr:S-adenosyl-L-methionine-dependent methyltransferase [Catenaria anguillulae PL171]